MMCVDVITLTAIKGTCVYVFLCLNIFALILNTVNINRYNLANKQKSFGVVNNS